MYFYVDESGQTGADLFNKEQPMLYYGVLSSPLDIDVEAENECAAMRQELDVNCLHAVDLGNGDLAKIANRLIHVHRELPLHLDVYRVAKQDHAIISFFDQVFDAGLNEAANWLGYWSPLRYALLLQLAALFDEKMARLAWTARTTKKDPKAQADMQMVCRTLRDRTGLIREQRPRKLISETLAWAEANPAAILYNAKDKPGIDQITPNLVGFQGVMQFIARRLQEANCKATKIVVEHQSEFNTAQKVLSEYYAAASGIVDMPGLGPGMPEMDYSAMPSIALDIPPKGTVRAGLELVDIDLWIIKRYMENRSLAPALRPLLEKIAPHAEFNEISLAAIAERWIPQFRQWTNDAANLSSDDLVSPRTWS